MGTAVTVLGIVRLLIVLYTTVILFFATHTGANPKKETLASVRILTRILGANAPNVAGGR